MSGRGIELGRIFGIPIRVDYSWAIIAALMTLSFAVEFGRDYPYLGMPARLSLGLSACVLLFASVLAHELSHAVVALRNSVSIRGITLFIFGGAAEMTEEPKSAGAEFRIAVAGPAMSLALAVAFLGMYRVVHGVIPLPFTDVVELLARMNLVLVAFNVVPGFPLDGGRVLRAALWGIWGTFSAATRVASGVGAFFGSLVVLMGLVWIFFFGNLFGGLWFVFIGLFLRSAARSSYQQLLVRNALRGVVARDVMERDVPCVPPGMRLSTVVDEVLLPSGVTAVPVVDRGLLVGMLTQQSLRGRDRASLEATTAAELMRADVVAEAVAPDALVADVLPRLAQGEGRLPVVLDGVLVGILTREGAMRRLSLMLSMGSGGEDGRSV